jgi:hypothetical protein
VKVALQDENSRPWYNVEIDFSDSEYREVCDRQMKELEWKMIWPPEVLFAVIVKLERLISKNLYEETYG